MLKLIRVTFLGTCVIATSLLSGCLVVPVHDHHRCGYHHCW